MSNRNEKAAELVRQAAAEFFSREAAPPPLGGLITVTRAEIAGDFSHATVFLTVLPEDKEPGALSLAHRRVDDFKELLRARAKLPKMPRVEFDIDRGQKNFERLRDLS